MIRFGCVGVFETRQKQREVMCVFSPIKPYSGYRIQYSEDGDLLMYNDGSCEVREIYGVVWRCLCRGGGHGDVEDMVSIFYTTDS